MEKTEDVRKYAEMEEMRKRDKDQERIAKKHKQNKDSLVDMHKKKMKKDKVVNFILFLHIQFIYESFFRIIG